MAFILLGLYMLSLSYLPIIHILVDEINIRKGDNAGFQNKSLEAYKIVNCPWYKG